MERFQRWCPCCGRLTWWAKEIRPPKLRYRWTTFWPLLWLAWRLTDRPECLDCLQRRIREQPTDDDQGDDER